MIIQLKKGNCQKLTEVQKKKINIQALGNWTGLGKAAPRAKNGNVLKYFWCQSDFCLDCLLSSRCSCFVKSAVEAFTGSQWRVVHHQGSL